MILSRFFYWRRKFLSIILFVFSSVYGGKIYIRLHISNFARNVMQCHAAYKTYDIIMSRHDQLQRWSITLCRRFQCRQGLNISQFRFHKQPLLYFKGFFLLALILIRTYSNKFLWYFFDAKRPTENENKQIDQNYYYFYYYYQLSKLKNPPLSYIEAF